MELAFIPKKESGWRARGAPPRPVPEQILEMLRRAGNGEVGVLDTSNDSDDDIADVMAALRAGGRHLGRRVRIQEDREAGKLRFELAPKGTT